jgi:lysophospholipase L1-like esterase
MVSARTARRIATTAAYGGGGVGLAGAGFYGLLRLQAGLARRAIGQPADDAPKADGRYGHYAGEPISVVVLGDSSAAGVGVHTPEQTPGALIAAGLAEIAARPVELTVVARTAARTSDLAEQIRQAADARPELALVMVGANDVTHRVRATMSVRLLAEGVRQLRAAGAAVVVGTCPDLGTVEPIPHPLRWVARRASRRLAAAQTIAAVEAGARTVSVGSILGPEFAAQPGHMFSPDRFHPSTAGYAAAAAIMLPSAASALKLSSKRKSGRKHAAETRCSPSRRPRRKLRRTREPRSSPRRSQDAIAGRSDAGHSFGIAVAGRCQPPNESTSRTRPRSRTDRRARRCEYRGCY